MQKCNMDCRIKKIPTWVKKGFFRFQSSKNGVESSLMAQMKGITDTNRTNNKSYKSWIDPMVISLKEVGQMGKSWIPYHISTKKWVNWKFLYYAMKNHHTSMNSQVGSYEIITWQKLSGITKITNFGDGNLDKKHDFWVGQSFLVHLIDNVK